MGELYDETDIVLGFLLRCIMRPGYPVSLEFGLAISLALSEGETASTLSHQLLLILLQEDWHCELKWSLPTLATSMGSGQGTFAFWMQGND